MLCIKILLANVMHTSGFLTYLYGPKTMLFTACFTYIFKCMVGQIYIYGVEFHISLVLSVKLAFQTYIDI